MPTKEIRLQVYFSIIIGNILELSGMRVLQVLVLGRVFITPVRQITGPESK